MCTFVRQHARGRQIHRIWLNKPSKQCNYGFTLQDGSPDGKAGIFVKTREQDEGIVQHTDLQINDQLLAVNCMHMERRMTVFKVNRLLHTLLGDIDLIIARGEYTLPEWTPQDETNYQQKMGNEVQEDNKIEKSKSFKKSVSRSSSKRNLEDKNSTEMKDLSRANSLGRTPTSKRTDSIAGSIKSKLRKNKSKRGQSVKSRRSMSRGAPSQSRKSSRRSTIRKNPNKDGVVKRRGRSVRSIASSILSVTDGVKNDQHIFLKPQVFVCLALISSSTIKFINKRPKK